MLLRNTPRCSGFAGAALFAALSLTACGSRTPLRGGDGSAHDDGPQTVEPECVTDVDCASACSTRICNSDGHCIATKSIVNCDDADPCTADSCDDVTGCVNSPVTPDVDMDGHRAALPGHLPGDLGSCGDDCDDTSARALPGGIETCDGRDNDCDGVVDNGQPYLNPRFQIPIRLASDDAQASVASGIAFGASTFATSYGAQTDLWRTYLRGLSSAGQPVFGQTEATDVNVLSFGAVLSWSGNAFAAAWPDPRADKNYEIYFARFDGQGNKLGPDLRVTDAVDFSLHPNMIYDQGQFLLAWDDRRDAGGADEARIYGQIIDSEGKLRGKNVPLSLGNAVSENPQLAITERRIGVAYSVLAPPKVGAHFRSFDKQFGDAGDITVLGDGTVEGPRLTGLRDRFVLSWGTYDKAPGGSIMAAVLDEVGHVTISDTPITFGAAHARTHVTVSLGDRFVLIWADDQTGSYELYAQVLGPNLEVLEPRTRLTFDGKDAVSPYAALSDDGTLGIAFDQFAGGHQAYFTAIGCLFEGGAPDGGRLLR